MLYPIQRNLTQRMRDDALRDGKIDGMQAWAGQSARLATSKPASDIVTELWDDAQEHLAG
ncbi:MAG: hypothetical protein AAFQ35_01590 [Pseudomonadota bacterium]